MGKSVGLPDMWVLIALFVGGQIFGFLGVLLAVPTAAVIKIFLARAVDMYHESELYLEGPASLRSIPPPEPGRGSTLPPSSPSQPPPATGSSPSASATPQSTFKTPLTGSLVTGRRSEPPKG
jgi:hypothetical protein